MMMMVDSSYRDLVATNVEMLSAPGAPKWCILVSDSGVPLQFSVAADGRPRFTKSIGNPMFSAFLVQHSPLVLQCATMAGCEAKVKTLRDYLAEELERIDAA